MVKVLLTEYVLSTFRPSNTTYKPLLPEALNMVLTLTKVLQIAGAEVFITLSRYLQDELKLNNSIAVDNYFTFLEKAKGFDYIIAIAPPPELIAIHRILRDVILGPAPEVVEVLSNKYRAITILDNCGLKTPQTIATCDDSFNVDLSKLDFPVVVKPLMSAGAECVYVVRDIEDLSNVVSKVRNCDPEGCVAIQEYIEGVHGSISIVTYNGVDHLYSLNLQLISISNNRVTYHGNIVPIRDHKVNNTAKFVAKKLLNCVRLKGYIGIDVVWNQKGMYIVEVNPRFTTSGIAMAELFPGLGRVLLGLEEISESVSLSSIVQGYGYVVKCPRGVDRAYSISYYAKSLIVGRANTFHQVIDDITKYCKDDVNRLVYDIRAIKG